MNMKKDILLTVLLLTIMLLTSCASAKIDTSSKRGKTQFNQTYDPYKGESESNLQMYRLYMGKIKKNKQKSINYK